MWMRLARLRALSKQFVRSRVCAVGAVALSSSVFIVSSSALSNTSAQTDSKITRANDTNDRESNISIEEVEKHNQADDAWIVIDGEVYDVTSFIDAHPGGGGVLRKHLGQDVSHIFTHLHSSFARNLLPGLHIGHVSSPYTSPFLSSAVEEQERAHLQQEKQHKRRVCIVGAGVCGTALSSLLAISKDNEIVVIDSAPLVGGTALKSTAILFVGPVIETHGSSKVSLNDWSGHVSFDMIKNLKDVEFVERGTLGVFADKESFARAKPKFAEGGRLHGSGTEIVERERMLEIEPQLSPDLVGATWQPKGATVDPFLVCDAYAKEAQAAGARYLLGWSVDKLERIQEHPQGYKFQVEAAGADGQRLSVACDDVVLATGWMCGELAKQLGHSVAVAGMHGQLFTSQVDGLKLNTNVFSWEGPDYWIRNPKAGQSTLESGTHRRLTRHFYAVQQANGTLKIGGDRERLSNDEPIGHVLEEGIEETQRQAMEIFPALRPENLGLHVTGTWCGVMPFTPNQTPSLGELEPGLWVAAGAPFFKGPAYAKLLADAIQGEVKEGSLEERLLRDADPLKAAHKKD